MYSDVTSSVTSKEVCEFVEKIGGVLDADTPNCNNPVISKSKKAKTEIGIITT